MRYTELIAENDDNDMFGVSDRVPRDIRRVTYQQKIPDMAQFIYAGLRANAPQRARDIARLLMRETKIFDPEELWGLAEDMLANDVNHYVIGLLQDFANDPDDIQDHDSLADVIGNEIAAEIRGNSELWMYVTEMLEAENSDGGDLEYDCAMEIEGEIVLLLSQLASAAYANLSMRHQEITSESEDDQEIMEVEMNPGAFQRFLASPAAEGIRAGFEAELIFRDTQGDPDEGGEGGPDFSQDERAYSIADIIDFFTGGDGSFSSQQAQRLENDMQKQYMDWIRESFRDDYLTESRFMEWAEENIWPEVEDDYREHARENLDDPDASDEDIEKEAIALFRNDAERDYQRNGEWSERADEELYDDYRSEADEADWLNENGIRSMLDVYNVWNIPWPYYTESSNSGRDWEDIGASLERVTGMPVRVSSGYHGATRREGQYIIEPDSSLDSDDSEDFGLEVISPPLPLPEAVEQLRRIIDWANGEGNAYTNSSTGLHMGVSLPVKGEKVDPIKLILFMGDRNLLEMFGRESNTYARSAYERLESKVRSMKNAGPLQISAIMDTMKNNLIELAMRDVEGVLGDKYVSVHPQNGYIEFRGPGEDYLAKEDEIDNILENTMLRLAYAMSIAGDDSVYRQEYAKKLYKVLTGFRGAETEKDERTGRTRTKIDTGSDDPFMRLFSEYSAGQINAQELKARWADTVLAAERDDVEDEPDVPVGAARDYEVYDRNTGEIYKTFRAYTDDEALEQFSRHYRAPYAQRGLPVLRVKAPGQKSKEPTSRRAELAKRVTRSTKDVGEQLWRVNHHSSVRWVTARSQAEAVEQAIKQDRMFNSPETRARIATDLEKQQWQLDQEARALRQRDVAQIRARLGAPQSAGTIETLPNTSRNADANWAIARKNSNEIVMPFTKNTQQEAEEYFRDWVQDRISGPSQYKLVKLAPLTQIGDAIPVGTYSTPGGPSYTVANDPRATVAWLTRHGGPRNQQTVAEMMANLKNKLEGIG